MPTVLRVRGYRIGFYAADGDEPQHVHVREGKKEAKYWLRPFIRLARNKGFRPHELTEIEKIVERHSDVILETWNEYLNVESELDVGPVAVRVSENELSVDLEDGRTISVPLSWYPRLHHATAAERSRFEMSGAGIHWPDLDEDISVRGLLLGRKSGESSASLKFWLDARAKGRKTTLEDFVKHRRHLTTRKTRPRQKSERKADVGGR